MPAVKPQVDVRGLCQLKNCHGTLGGGMPTRASVWVAWPKIGVVTLCQECWEDIKRWEVDLHKEHRTPDEWVAWIKNSLRQRYE